MVAPIAPRGIHSGRGKAKGRARRRVNNEIPSLGGEKLRMECRSALCIRDGEAVPGCSPGLYWI
ncbi:MAG: hypothetical protein LUQ37_04260 [Methanoregulaceae archaeon]|nr:hypothetical protein [Methanoregulaceae archaeon]